MKYYYEILIMLRNINKIPKEFVIPLLRENKYIVKSNFEDSKTVEETAYQLAKYYNYYQEIKEYLLERTGIPEEKILQLAKEHKRRFIDSIEEGKTIEEVRHDLWLIERIGLE